MAMAGHLGLATRPLRLELEALPQLRLPCILHWEFNHFVVLKEVGPRGVVIHDPARGCASLASKRSPGPSPASPWSYGLTAISSRAR